jgi:membrane protein DedA with SNARE-associated domain
MPVVTFVLFSAIGMLIWNTVLVTAGYLLHEHYHLVEAWVDPLTYVVLGLVVAVYLFRLVTWKPSTHSTIK